MTLKPEGHKTFKFSIDGEIYDAFCLICDHAAGPRSISFLIRQLMNEFVYENLRVIPDDRRERVKMLIEKYRGS